MTRTLSSLMIRVLLNVALLSMPIWASAQENASLAARGTSGSDPAVPSEVAEADLPSTPGPADPAPTPAPDANPAFLVSVEPQPPITLESKSSAHPFWDRQNCVLFSAVGGLATADFLMTRQNLASGGREMNPVTRLFSGSTPGLAANFVLETGAIVGTSYLLHKTGHHRLERIVSFVNIGASATAVTYSYAHRH